MRGAILANSRRGPSPQLMVPELWEALVADVVIHDGEVSDRARPAHSRSLTRHRSLVGLLFALPLIIVIAALVIYPAGYSLHLATLNKSMQHFVGLSNFSF